MARAGSWSWTNQKRADFLPLSLLSNLRSLPHLFQAALREGFFSALPSRWTGKQEYFMMNPDMRILVVEDDKKIASFVVNGLKQSGYAVDSCADGEEALDLAATTPYDAAVVDLMLPKLDGLSVIQRWRGKGTRV